MKSYINFYKPILMLLFIGSSLSEWSIIKGQTKSVDKMDLFKTSPETSKLFQKVDIPVNYSTGGLNYSLPIYTIRLKNLDIPIQLNYRSSGLQVNENATSVGLGWDLEIGGSITQTKKQGSGPENRIYFDENRIIDPRCIDDTYKPQPVERCSESDYGWVMSSAFGGNQNYALYALQLKTGDPIDGHVTRRVPLHTFTYDLKTEQDIFYYSLPGEAGKFFYDSNKKKYFTIPYTRNEIEHTSEFYIMKDSKGNKYYFSKTENTEWQNAQSIATYYSNGAGQDEVLPRNPTAGVAKYFLKKIETGNGDIVEFSYSPIIYRIDHPEVFNYITQVNSDPRNSIPSRDDASQINSTFRDSKVWGRTIITTNKLDKITINGRDVVNLKYSSEARKDLNHSNLQQDLQPGDIISVTDDKKPKSIDEIIIADSGRKIICHFNYDYFGKEGVPNSNDNISTSKKYRLKLNSVSFNDGSLYNFKYYEDNNIVLPDKNSADNKDVLGYFNNQKHLYTTSKTKDEIQNMMSSTYKKPNLEATQLTVLKSIEYPTKSKDEFSYALGGEYGGLNIETIKSYENINSDIPSLYKTFKYLSPHSIEPKNVNTITANVFKYEYEGIPSSLAGAIGTFTFSSYSSSTINELIAFNGFPNFYETVEEYVYDKEHNNKGMTRYNFTYEENPEFTSYGPYHFTVPLTDNGWKRGLLKSATTFKAGDFITPIKNITNTYKFGDLNFDYQNLTLGSALPSVNKNQGYFVNYLISLTSPEVKYENHTPDVSLILPFQPEAKFTTHVNLFVSGSVYKTSETITEKFGNKSLITKTDYNYDEVGSNQLKSQKTTYPDGNISETSYSYAEDEAKADMIQANMVSIPLKTEIKLNDKVVSKTYTDYQKNAKTSNLVLPVFSQSSDLQNPLVSINELTYDLYDNKGNILQYTEKGKKPTSIVWGYNQKLPIAKIEGALYQQISEYITSIVSASDTDNTEGSTLSEQALISTLDTFKNRLELSRYQITTYTYDPLVGITSITPPSGLRENYKYNNITNRLELITDVDHNILKEYKYHYTETYYSTQKDRTFIKTSCPDGFIPGTYNYIVPSGKYYSIISQADADQKAEDDINKNGQNITNQYASCTGYFNTFTEKAFTRNNCQSNETGGTYIYTVPAGKYFSTISQADADQKAENDINQNGQNSANQYASCRANGFYNIQKGKSFIKNNCPSNTTPGSYYYTVPAGKYYSTISQADADQKADNDINQNGQDIANQNAECIAGECEIDSNGVDDVVSINSRIVEITTGHFKGNISAQLSTSVNQYSSIITLGNIGTSCSPLVNEKQITVTANNGSVWRVYIHPNGEVSLRFISGTFTRQISLTFEYDKN
ncbi:DUF5977 domain-containing protein [Elizabethkingia meningoseptica]|uniref:DUF5977 domain-containing protein n=2 Tax=Elizabethkingia meningoseptica TaxID=238 RepID=UPI0003A5A41B|nr:DUF5977 domain-containing protein [Elizabethkingia meningoseptica]SQG06882.1 Uncharacterised protein [Elizabethkingia meningoseptica]